MSTPAERGFTLVELMIAMALTVIILVSISGMFMHALTAGRRSTEDTRAIVEASNRLEKLLATPFSSADWTSGAHQESRDFYTIRWFVATDSPSLGTRTVAISAWRPGSTRRTTTVALKTR